MATKGETYPPALDAAIRRYYAWGGCKVVRLACPGLHLTDPKIWKRARMLGVRKIPGLRRYGWEDIGLGGKKEKDDAKDD